MLAIIPSSVTTHGGWLSENALISNQWMDDGGGSVSESFIQFSSPQSSQQVKLESCSPQSGGDGGCRGGGCTVDGDDLTAMAKKLKHNANERDRRRKINSLYYSLRSLLPPTNLMKRVSNPCTISRALKYIPELQQQVEGLRRRKQDIVTKFNANPHEEKQIGKNIKAAPWMSSLCAVNWLSETEALLQIASEETLKQLPFSQILLSLEEDGLLLLSASSFQSFDGRLFFTLLLQVKANTPSRVLQETLNKKVKPL